MANIDVANHYGKREERNVKHVPQGNYCATG